MKLIDIKEYTGKIELKSGLHIGSGDSDMRIGGADSTVIKHPVTNEPYIPGSSLKGKIRALLEMTTGKMVETAGKPLGVKNFNSCNEKGKNIIKLFGCSNDNDEMALEIGPTRLSFADAVLAKQYDDLYEVKSENSINRIKGTADNPRFIERVISGITFKFSISQKIFEGDNEEEMLKCLLSGIALLERDALGGAGSRGYGKVEFTFDDPEIQDKLNKEEA